MVELSQNPTGVTSAGAGLLVAAIVVLAVVAEGAVEAGCGCVVGLTASECSAKLKAPRAAAESAMTVRAPMAIPEARFMT